MYHMYLLIVKLLMLKFYNYMEIKFALIFYYNNFQQQKRQQLKKLYLFAQNENMTNAMFIYSL